MMVDQSLNQMSNPVQKIFLNTAMHVSEKATNCY